MVTSLAIGIALMAVGFILFARPQIIDWLNEQTNARAGRWWGGRRYDERYRVRQRKILHTYFPVFFALLGAAVILHGIS
jgi:hypothetical protein